MHYEYLVWRDIAGAPVRWDQAVECAKTLPRDAAIIDLVKVLRSFSALDLDEGQAHYWANHEYLRPTYRSSMRRGSRPRIVPLVAFARFGFVAALQMVMAFSNAPSDSTLAEGWHYQIGDLTLMMQEILPGAASLEHQGSLYLIESKFDCSKELFRFGHLIEKCLFESDPDMHGRADAHFMERYSTGITEASKSLRTLTILFSSRDQQHAWKNQQSCSADIIGRLAGVGASLNKLFDSLVFQPVVPRGVMDVQSLSWLGQMSQHPLGKVDDRFYALDNAGLLRASTSGLLEKIAGADGHMSWNEVSSWIGKSFEVYVRDFLGLCDCPFEDLDDEGTWSAQYKTAGAKSDFIIPTKDGQYVLELLHLVSPWDRKLDTDRFDVAAKRMAKKAGQLHEFIQTNRWLLTPLVRPIVVTLDETGTRWGHDKVLQEAWAQSEARHGAIESCGRPILLHVGTLEKLAHVSGAIAPSDLMDDTMAITNEHARAILYEIPDHGWKPKLLATFKALTRVTGEG